MKETSAAKLGKAFENNVLRDQVPIDGVGGRGCPCVIAGSTIPSNVRVSPLRAVTVDFMW